MFRTMGCAAILVAAFSSGASAEMRAFTLAGHHFRFDVPADYKEESRASSGDDTKSFHRDGIQPGAGSDIAFYADRKTMEEVFASDKRIVRRFNGRVGYLPYTGPKPTIFFGFVFARACSGKCVIKVGIIGGDAGNPNLRSELDPLVEKYLQILGSGGYGGD